MGVRRGIDRKKVGFRSLIDANLEGQVGVNKFKLYTNTMFVYRLPTGHCVQVETTSPFTGVCMSTSASVIPSAASWSRTLSRNPPDQ